MRLREIVLEITAEIKKSGETLKKEFQRCGECVGRGLERMVESLGADEMKCWLEGAAFLGSEGVPATEGLQKDAVGNMH